MLIGNLVPRFGGSGQGPRAHQWSHTFVRWLAAEFGKLMASTPECFAAYIKTEIERWVVILKNSGAGLE